MPGWKCLGDPLPAPGKGRWRTALGENTQQTVMATGSNKRTPNWRGERNPGVPQGAALRARRNPKYM